MPDKKSQVEDLLSLLLLIIFIVFLALFLSFKGVGTAQSIKENADTKILGLNSDQLLINYLSLQFDSEDSQNNVADALNKYFTTNSENLLKQIKAKTNEFFSRSVLQTDSSSWSLEILHSEKNPIIIESRDSETKHQSRRQVSEIIIPSHNTIKPIKIKLFYVQTKYTEE